MTEAFVYIWFDLGRNMRYIGVHKGSPEDGYVCHSDTMLLEHTLRPQEFRRQVMHHGTWKEMLLKEQELIASMGAVKDPKYYNQANNLGPYYADWTGKRKSLEHRAKLSAAAKNRPKVSAETCAKISVATKGKPKTLEHRMKIGVAHRGKKRPPFSESWKENMRKRQLGVVPGNKGNPHSSETKLKISTTLKEKWAKKKEQSTTIINGKNGH